MIQLRVPLPVRVVPGAGWSGPTGTGMCLAWYKPHVEHNLIWLVAFDDTGQVWEVENPNIRATANITWGRSRPQGAADPAEKMLAAA
jgi:hypothetical protein